MQEFKNRRPSPNWRTSVLNRAQNSFAPPLATIAAAAPIVEYDQALRSETSNLGAIPIRGGPPYNACVFYPSTSWRVHPNPLFPFQLLLVYAYKVKPLTRIAPHSLTKVMILKKKPVYVTGSHFH